MIDFSAIARDLELCDVGIAITKGKRRKAFQQQRELCNKAIRDQNIADGLNQMSADDIEAALKV